MFKYLISFLFFSHSVFALTVLNVTLSTDNSPGTSGEVGDLRYCLNTMNEGLNTNPDDYQIIFANPMTIYLNGILPLINNSSNLVNITIGNPGSIPTVIIDGNGSYGGFFIPMGNVTIQNIIFQNLSVKGGNGGSGISGGGGGMGAGGAIYAPQAFLNGINPSITLMNVSISNCSAIGGDGGNYLNSSLTGDEGGGGGGGGFGGNGGSVTTIGSTGGGGGGGFGGNGGNVTLSLNDPLGGGGGGGGGLGSRASIGSPTNLGNGGSDQESGSAGNGYGLINSAGTGGGGYTGGANAGGGGGGGAINNTVLSGGGGGGGDLGTNGLQPQAFTPPGNALSPSGGNGKDGGGAGGGAVVVISLSTNSVDGQAGSGGYFGGGGGGAGVGGYASGYTVQGGSGGVGGGGGGGGVDQSGSTPALGGNSLGGGGGGGGGPSNSGSALGGSDIGFLGGGSGGVGGSNVGSEYGGGGGGGGSALGGAIFVDSYLNFTIKAFAGIPTIFNTVNNTIQAGNYGIGASQDSNGFSGSALGNSIFLRTGSSLTFMAEDINDLLTLGEEVGFVDDTIFGGEGTTVEVKGNGTIIYNGTTDYQGVIRVNNANFKVNGQINEASILVCRNIGFSAQRGVLSGRGILTGNVYVNSGIISPDSGRTLTLGGLSLNSADPLNDTLGSLVHIEINSTSTSSVVNVNGEASLAGVLEIDLHPNALIGIYTLLTSSGITGSFDSIKFTGEIPNYSISYVPSINPTSVQLNFLGYPSPPVPPRPPFPKPLIYPPTDLKGKQVKKKCGEKIKIFNVVKWSPPTSGIRPFAYRVYRKNFKNLIAIVPASGKLKFKDKVHRSNSKNIYYIISEDKDLLSYPASIQLKSKNQKDKIELFSSVSSIRGINLGKSKSSLPFSLERQFFPPNNSSDKDATQIKTKPKRLKRVNS